MMQHVAKMSTLNRALISTTHISMQTYSSPNIKISSHPTPTQDVHLFSNVVTPLPFVHLPQSNPANNYKCNTEKLHV